LTDDLGVSNEIGISNYLISDKIPLEAIIKPIPGIPNLSIIGSGPIPPNPSELMAIPRIGDLIADLKVMFDYIIIDTAPVAQVADALALVKCNDSTINLVRYNYTFNEQLKIVEDIYRNKKLKYLMLVLNDAKKHSGYGYGYG